MAEALAQSVRSPMLVSMLGGLAFVEGLRVRRQRRGCLGCRRPWLLANIVSYAEEQVAGAREDAN